jgi:hypothetical protein
VIPKNNSSNIYAAIKRDNEKTFQKIKNGEYRLITQDTQIIKQEEPKKKRSGKTSGLRVVVKHLKSEHPEWSKNDVLKYLKKIEFDFKGRNPNKAVNITWAHLGFSKEGKTPFLSPEFSAVAK